MRSRTISNRSASPRPANIDRRQRARLRELCDEVLASFRLAAGRDPITAEDREKAMELMRGLGPVGGLTLS